MENFIAQLTQEHFEADKMAFINFIRGSFPVCADEALDIYIDVWADTIANIRRGKTERVRNWKVYIFVLGWKRACKMATRSAETERIDAQETTAPDYEAACLRDVEDSIRHMRHLEKIERAMEALERLPEKHKEVLDLYYLKGLSTTEIAEKMGYSGQRTVITVKRRSVDLLRKHAVA